MPGQGFFEVPGASLGTGYVIPGAPDAESALPAALADVNAALADHDEREAALPPDPGIVNARNSIKREYDAAAADWAERKKNHYEHPDRSRYKPEGLTAFDT